MTRSIKRRTFIQAGAAAAAVSALSMPNILKAKPLSLRLHHFNSPLSIAHKKFLLPWAAKLKAESNGELDIKVFPAMQLGGKPGQLYSQAKDGVVDMVWTIPGYTANRFHVTEVFELPFMAGAAAHTSPAVQEFSKKHFDKEYEDTHPILFHTHAPGSLHTAKTPIRKLEDMKGLRLRGPSRPITQALKAMGAVPVGMPVPKVTESVSRGVVEGAALPWTITKPIRLHEVTNFHTEAGFYCLVFGLIMNKKVWASMPSDLQGVINNNSSMDFVKHLGVMWDDDEKPGKALAVKKGSEIITLSSSEKARWKKACEPVIAEWMARGKKFGYDGEALYAEAEALIAKYAAS